MHFYFFFFQAEDGIRDIGVTGVQTCALPILLRRNHSQSECAKCAVEPFLRGTIPSAKFLRRLIGPSNASESLPRRNPLLPAPLFSWPGGKRFDARFAATRFPRRAARRVPVF